MIHVPSRELDGERSETGGETDPAAAARKRTRRGSRGGRNRRKKPATPAGTSAGTVVEVGAVETIAVEEPRSNNGAAQTDEPAGEWTYTPMSEWGDS